MNIEKLNKLRDIVYRLLVIHLNIKEEPEINILVRKMVNRIEDEEVLRNLTYIKYVLNPVYVYTKKLEIDEFSDYSLCQMLLILKATKSSKYRKYSLLQLIEEFYGESNNETKLDADLYTLDGYHFDYIDDLFNTEYWDDDD